MIVKGTFRNGKPMVCYSSLADRLSDIHRLQDELTSSPSSHDMLELAMATATSLDICLADETPLVWSIMAGAPGSDKTQTVLAMREAVNAYFLDTLTGNSFITGFVPEGGKKPVEDLLPQLDGKCLVIKDMTTLFSLREDKVKEILGALQSIYDGAYARSIGTRGTVKYNSRFTILGCVTPLTLRKHHRYMSQIGSRFLIYRILPLTEEQIEEGFALVWDTGDRKHKLQELQRLVIEHIEDVLTCPFVLEPETPEQQDTINRLARLLAQGRTVLHSQRVQNDFDKFEYQITDRQTEHPWRAVHQLRNLARSLARIHGRSQVTDHELELLRRVVLSSIAVDWAECIRQFSVYSDGFTSEQCAEGIGKSQEWTRKLLHELLMTNIVHAEKLDKAKRMYRPEPEFQEFLVRPIDPLDHGNDLGTKDYQQNLP